MRARELASHPPQLGPHAPERGRLARLLGPFHVTGVFWYRFHLWGVRCLPRWSLPILVELFTLLFFFTLFRIRRAIARNLVPVLGRVGFFGRQRRIWRTMREFAWCLHERYEHMAHGGAPAVEVDQRETWDEVVSGGAGFIVLTAHIGCWEVAAAVLAEQLSRRVHLVREEEIAPEAQRFLSELIEQRSAGRFVTHFAGDPRLALELREVLARGEIAALQGDRPRAGGRSLRVTAFGRTLELPAGPFVLARLSGAPLLPAFAFREGRWRYRIAFREAVHVPDTGDRDRDLEQAAQAVAHSFEWAVRRSPFQWFCFREAWSDEERPHPDARRRAQSGSA